MEFFAIQSINLTIRETGKIIVQMALGHKIIEMEADMMENSRMDWNMEKVIFTGQMVRSTPESSRRAICMDMDFWQKEKEYTKEASTGIKSRDMERCVRNTVNTKVHLWMVRCKAMDSLFGMIRKYIVEASEETKCTETAW